MSGYPTDVPGHQLIHPDRPCALEQRQADGRRRRLEVKCPGRHGVDVLTTESYYAPDASATPKHPLPSPSSQPALADLLPDPGVSLQLAAEPFKQDDKTAMIAVVLGVSGGVGLAGHWNVGDTADVTVRAFSSSRPAW